jgi:hypothetical protein
MKFLGLLLATLASPLALAETPPGTVVASSPAATKNFIGSPSLLILPNGHLLAAHDFFGAGKASGACIYGSQDQGATWTLLSSLPD